MAKLKKQLRLRVMAEYASSGIWGIKTVGSFRHGMIEHDSLNLPSQLAQGFVDWIEHYYDRLEIDEAVFDVDAFNVEGRRLATELKAFLGADAYVEFIPEHDTEGLGPAQEIKLRD